MQTLFDLLADKYPSAAQCAAALGCSRQAYSQAQKRRRLSESKAMLAGELLGISPAAALLTNAGRAELPAADHPPAPIQTTRIDACNALNISDCDTTNYALFDGIKKSANAPDNIQNVHYLISEDQQEAIDLIRWVYAVARLPADSPRFNHYVSRWAVPDKIARSKAARTFEELTRNCPPIDPAWVRLVPAALAECQRFIEQTTTPRKTPASSSTKAKGRNIAPLAA